MKYLRWGIVCSLFFCLDAYAADSYFCSTTSQYIYLGNTIDQVLASCGQPQATSEEDTPSSQPTLVTQWIYNFQNNAQLRKLNTPNYQMAALIVNMVDNKVVSLLVNGQSVSTTNFCGTNIALNVGDSNLKVRQICSQPTQIQQVTQNIAQPSAKNVIWTYQQQFRPAATLTFQNGILQSIE